MASAQVRGKLWGVTTKGNVYTLDVKTGQWSYVPNHGQVLRGFKRVSCTHNGAWGLGCDHQVYVYITNSDVPIRCQVTTYENERWVPARGWSSQHLLPGVDPWQWSSEDGNVHLPKEVFKLPSDNWQWESDWCVDENVCGFLTDKGGWRYSSVDFHGHFSHQKSFRSCVRRRKWVRHYRYTSYGVWAKIPSIHVDPLEEPIVDLAAGGQDIPNQLPGFVAVWAVTIDGRVLFRTGIGSQCPEGQAWVDVPITQGDEVLSIGVGPTDLVWATTWAGHLLIRTGINWQNPRGTAWVRLNAPMSEDKLVQVATGDKTVWVTTVTGHVWFRKGVKDCSCNKNSTEYLKGTGWLRMVNEMKMIATGPQDRVWGIDYESRRVYFRQGISPEEPSGRVWSCITAVLQPTRGLAIGQRVQSQLSMASSASSGSSVKDVSILSEHNNHLSLSDRCSNIPGQFSMCEDQFVEQNHGRLEPADIGQHESDKTLSIQVPKSRSAPTNLTRENTNSENDLDVSGQDPSIRVKSRSAPHQLMHHIQNKAKARSKKLVKFLRDRITKDLLTDVPHDDSNEGMSVRFATTTSSLELNYENHINIGECDSLLDETSILESQSTELGYPDECLDSGRNHLATQPDNEDVLWLWLSANNCYISDEAHIKHWFSAKTGSDTNSGKAIEYQHQLSDSLWHNTILSLLKERYERCHAPYAQFPVAIERSCWRKNGQLKWWSDTERKPKWINAEVELIQDSDTLEKNGTFTIQYKIKHQPKHMIFPLKDIAAVTMVTEPNLMAVFALHVTERLHASPRRPPVKLLANAEQEMEDWVAALSVACCDHRAVQGTAHPNSIWTLTARGDIFVHEPDPYLPSECITDMFWHQYGGHLRQVETCPVGVTWGIGYDGHVYVYSGGYGGGFFKGMSSSPHGINSQADTREVFVYENQRWRPLSGYTDRMLFTDSHSWSDKTGKIQQTKEGTKLPSKHWTWSTDWMIDRRIEGGVDKDGWQYGRKINRPFYSQPRINSVIRRRCWVRKCTIMTTGPWLEIGSHLLKDISLQLDSSISSQLIPDVSVWAVSTDGEVLYRIGVSRTKPQGTSWIHIPTELPFTSVSIGSKYRVWATAIDGSVWIRHGTNADNPLGDCWFHVSPPPGAQLCKISAGTTVVWAVDTRRKLWCRKGITSSHVEGTEWLMIAHNVCHVSCGPNNQVWAVLDQIHTAEGLTDGIVCRRTGLLNDPSKHGSWEYGIGGGFSYVSVRGWTK